MTTQQLMDLALQRAGLEKMPEDCGIGQEGSGIKKVLMGVDMDTAELLLARELGYDCVVTHHPRNTNTEKLEVMNEHIKKLEALGVPRNKAQKLLNPRKQELELNQHVANSRRTESAAQLMKMPFMSIHTPADVISEAKVQNFLDEKFANNPDTTLDDICKALEEIPEYANSARKPVIRVGGKKDYAGKIYVLMSGLTGPGPEITKEYFNAGVGTLILMHIPEKDIKAVKEQNIGNVIVAGHMSSDSIGMNEIAKEWAKHGVETTMMSGVITH